MIYVPQLDRTEYIPKGIFEKLLAKEAQAFTTALMNIKIPTSSDRLRIPIITTQEKLMAEADNKCPVKAFIDENCEPTDGQCIPLEELHTAFLKQIDKSEERNWSRSVFRTTIPPQYAKGRFKGNKYYVGNLWWKDKPILVPREGKFIVHDGKIIMDSKAIKHGLQLDEYDKE
jgi:hypothetical protein